MELSISYINKISVFISTFYMDQEFYFAKAMSVIILPEFQVWVVIEIWKMWCLITDLYDT